ncbi:MAG: hypothetical protein CMH36_02720 [Microbacterium sp.]|nr:hypothetical protein [Microbacterium sp.]
MEEECEQFTPHRVVLGGIEVARCFEKLEIGRDRVGGLAHVRVQPTETLLHSLSLQGDVLEATL